MLDVSNIQAIILVKIAGLSLSENINPIKKYIMLKSKRDESIKRYLSKVGKLSHNSKHFSSRYYTISYGEDIELLVRFSDHFHRGDTNKSIGLEIIKTSLGFYTIRVLNAGISYTVVEDLVLPYLKSILLLYPEMDSTMSSYRESSKIAVRTANKAMQKAAVAESKLNQRDEYIDMVDSVYEENKNLQMQVNSLQGVLKDTQNKLNNANISVEASKRKFEKAMAECKNLRSKMTRLKDLLTSI